MQLLYSSKESFGFFSEHQYRALTGAEHLVCQITLRGHTLCALPTWNIEVVWNLLIGRTGGTLGFASIVFSLGCVRIWSTLAWDRPGLRHAQRPPTGHLKAQFSFSSGLPDEVTSMARRNSVKSMYPFLSTSNVRKTWSQNSPAFPVGKHLL